MAVCGAETVKNKSAAREQKWQRENGETYFWLEVKKAAWNAFHTSGAG